MPQLLVLVVDQVEALLAQLEVVLRMLLVVDKAVAQLVHQVDQEAPQVGVVA